MFKGLFRKKSPYDDCNHEMAKTMLIRKFSGGVIPKELAALLDAYTNNPCSESSESIGRL